MLPHRDLIEHPLTRAEFTEAQRVIGDVITPTPQIHWPLLSQRSGSEVWIKHENHLPTGAFKVRGGLWLIHQLMSAAQPPAGIVAATRGNHGQSLAFAGARVSLPAVIVVPHGNNPEKNEAMKALGAELVEHGEDFDAALTHAQALAKERNLFSVPSFHPTLVQGVGTYGCELLEAVPELDAVYVPIGLGSGICGMMAARRALGLNTEIIGVVSSHADAYAQSFECGSPVTTDSANTLADGLAVRTPSSEALRYLINGVSRIVRVNDEEVKRAVRALLEDTHNLAEGAGAAAVAAVLQERERYAGKRVAAVLSGGNLATSVLRDTLVPA